jgi:hypothetical protein
MKSEMDQFDHDQTALHEGGGIENALHTATQSYVYGPMEGEGYRGFHILALTDEGEYIPCIINKLDAHMWSSPFWSPPPSPKVIGECFARFDELYARLA